MCGTVRLGVTELIAVTWLPVLIDVLPTRLPKLQLQLEDVSAAAAAPLLHHCGGCAALAA